MGTLSSQAKAMETVKCCAERETANANVECDVEDHAPPQLIAPDGGCSTRASTNCIGWGGDEGHACLLVQLLSSKVTFILWTIRFSESNTLYVDENGE